MGIVLPLRILQALLALTVLGLSAYVANWYNMDTLTSSPRQVNFLIFAPLFSLLSIAYLELAPRFAPRASHPYAAIGLEVTNAIFYFSGFIALAVFISQLLFCRGSVCGAARAAATLGAFEFGLWATTAGLLLKDLFLKGGLRRQPSPPAPVMKEVA